MSSGLLWFLRKQKKSRADRFAYSDSLKRSLKWRYSVVASQFSVDTIPNAVRSQLSTKILSRSAPAELVRMVFLTSSSGARSARQFEGFVYVDGR